MGLRRRSDLLMEEAARDLEVGCYNKAVSAAYFSVRLLAESLLKMRTRRDDKIANALRRRLELAIGRWEAERVRREFLALFEARKRADHRADIFGREEAVE